MNIITNSPPKPSALDTFPVYKQYIGEGTSRFQLTVLFFNCNSGIVVESNGHSHKIGSWNDSWIFFDDPEKWRVVNMSVTFKS